MKTIDIDSLATITGGAGDTCTVQNSSYFPKRVTTASRSTVLGGPIHLRAGQDFLITDDQHPQYAPVTAHCNAGETVRLNYNNKPLKLK